MPTTAVGISATVASEDSIRLVSSSGVGFSAMWSVVAQIRSLRRMMAMMNTVSKLTAISMIPEISIPAMKSGGMKLSAVLILLAFK